MIHIEYILIISAVMMCAGIFGFITRRSTLAVLLSIELMLNSADLNFAVFNRMCNFGGNEGYLFSVTQGGGAANSKDYPHQGQVTYTTRELASTLRLNNSYGGGATCSYIYGLSILYGQ